MQVALIGATGNVGAHLLEELVRRGHSVTAIMRHMDTLPTAAAVTGVAADAADGAALRAAVRGLEAVMLSMRLASVDLDAVIGAITGSGVKRWVVAGGAGSLRDASGRLVLENAAMPAEILPEARAHAAFLDRLRGLGDVDWSYISPSMIFEEGARDGAYRVGGDTLLMDGKTPAHLSFQNFAVAMVDELELGRHIRKRFTVADPD